MKKKTLAVLLCTLGLAQAHAGETASTAASTREPAGLGVGALIGGLIAGPPGAIIGAAGGLLAGKRSAHKTDRIASLESRLAGRESELADLERAFATLGERQAAEQQRVRYEQRRDALGQLADGVSLNVYFRTASAELGAGDRARLVRLAAFLADFPELRLQIDAHADGRGTNEFNRRLSEARADAVTAALARAGLDGARLRGNAWGESQAMAGDDDVDGQALERRVEIRLGLEKEA